MRIDGELPTGRVDTDPRDPATGKQACEPAIAATDIEHRSGKLIRDDVMNIAW